MTSIHGPLGPLRGMTFDPVRNRYFPTPKDTPSQPASQMSSPALSHLPAVSSPLAGPSRNLRQQSTLDIRTPIDARCLSKRYGKSRMVDPLQDLPPIHVSRPRTGRMARRYTSGRGVENTSARDVLHKTQWSSLEFETKFDVGSCGGEKVTALKSYDGGAFFATTDHGKVVIRRRDGEMHDIAICAAGLMGMHCDIARMTMLVIASGPEAHIHHFRRDPANLEHVFMHHAELDVPGGDFFCADSFDGTCTIGGNKSLTSMRYAEGVVTRRRAMVSDVLAIHHHDENVVFAGLRSGIVSMEDLRVTPAHKRVNKIAATQKGKAVVGVKRLKDSAVPWGLVVSGMGDELLLYDIRFGQRPLRRFEGHVNKFHSDLGMETTPDDKFLFAAGSDNRLRLYSTTNGTRIQPTSSGFATPTSQSDPSTPFGDTLHPINFASRAIGPLASNPLSRIYEDNITSIGVRNDTWGLDLVVKGHMYRFNRENSRRKGWLGGYGGVERTRTHYEILEDEEDDVDSS